MRLDTHQEGPAYPSRRDGLFRAGLLVAIVLAYAPSLHHPPRADQWCFLNDTTQHYELVDAVQSTYSYNRTRQTLPGDTDLFRPILFVLLAVERTLLEGDLWSTQLIGVGLHVVVCQLLLSVLRRVEGIVVPEWPGGARPLTRSGLPCLMTAVFALSPNIIELVVWAHLHGYLLFLVFLLGGVNLLLRHLEGGAGRWLSPSLWGSWALVLLSAFTYELGQLLAVFCGVAAAAATHTRAGRLRALSLMAAFFSILFLYQGANKYDQWVHRDQFMPENLHGQIVDGVLTWDTPLHAIRYTLYTAVQPLCPSLTHAWMMGDRINVGEDLWYEPVLNHFGIVAAWSLPATLLFAGFTFSGFRGLVRSGRRLPLVILALFTSLWAAYAAMNVLGRMNLRPGTTCLSSNSYYAYPGWLFGVLIAYTLLRGVSRTSPAGALGWHFMIAGLTGLCIYSGIHVRATNARFGDEMKPMSATIRAFHGFIRHHQREPGFSLEIDYGNSDPIPGRYEKSVPEMMFARWMTRHAKYRVVYRHRAVVVVSVDGRPVKPK